MDALFEAHQLTTLGDGISLPISTVVYRPGSSSLTPPHRLLNTFLPCCAVPVMRCCWEWFCGVGAGAFRSGCCQLSMHAVKQAGNI